MPYVKSINYKNHLNNLVMKKINFKKKLSLNKKAITDLNDEQMNEVRGGTYYSYYYYNCSSYTSNYCGGTGGGGSSTSGCTGGGGYSPTYMW